MDAKLTFFAAALFRRSRLGKVKTAKPAKGRQNRQDVAFIESVVSEREHCQKDQANDAKADDFPDRMVGGWERHGNTYAGGTGLILGLVYETSKRSSVNNTSPYLV